jgi:hypothetical protein
MEFCYTLIMKIFVSHSTDFDYKNDLYIPIKKSTVNKKYKFFLPHEKKSIDIKSAIQNSDLVIAEISYPSTGQGIELIWAYEQNIPILSFYKISSKVPDSLKKISDKLIEYESMNDFLKKLEIILLKETEENFS